MSQHRFANDISEVEAGNARLIVRHLAAAPVVDILLADGTGAPSVNLVDLGLAVPQRAVRITREGGITGTVNYMAPEQRTNAKGVDERSDVYALGVVLFAMLTGRVPFRAPTRSELFRMILSQPPPSFREVAPELDIPDAVDGAQLTLNPPPTGVRLFLEQRLVPPDVSLKASLRYSRARRSNKEPT